MIGIVDYGLGNLRSIQNMLARSGVAAFVSADPSELKRADKLILPGVGHFAFGMEELRRRDLIAPLTAQAMEHGTPVLGICLGAQLLGRGSEEGGVEGLGWIQMDTIAFDRSRLSGEKVPHMGWTDTVHRGHPLFSGLESPARFYYVHSFHFSAAPRSVIAEAEHGYVFPTAVAERNVMGVQFHPEKSHVFGRQLLINFANAAFSG